MKKYLIYELIGRIRRDPKMLRGLILLTGLGVLALTVAASLVVWGGISAAKYASTKTKQVVETGMAKDYIEGIKTEISSLPKPDPKQCWSQVSSLFAVDPWLEFTLPEIFIQLNDSCLKHQADLCSGNDCKDTKLLIHSPEGSSI
jgi:hypothetical protein